MSQTDISRPDPIKAIVGTAGHIDHGKSALVRALTGIEPDRLPEERERGISIELGFAYLALPGGERVGVVDVPGHERFIRQMLAGAHGFDLVLVVVAADDGVMPQTEEHFDIVHLLGVRRAIFVISKADAVAPERVEQVREEIEILAAGTPFEDSPVMAASALTGEGIEPLRELITRTLATLPPRQTAKLPILRIPVDRVFVMKGHGVVITGTALSGAVAVGDEVRVLPAGNVGRVREVQVHGAAAAFAGEGQRVALNLSGLGKDDVARGDTIAGMGAELTTSRLDVRVEVRPSAGRALESHVTVRLHHGTRETMARLIWLDGVREVAPRSCAYAQLVTEEPLVACIGDRFVIRDQTAQRTLGGGVVLVARAERHRVARVKMAPLLEAMEKGEPADRLAAVLEMSPALALDPREAALAAGIDADSIAAIAGDQQRGSPAGRHGNSAPQIEALPRGGPPQVLLSAQRGRQFRQHLLDAVAAHHRQHPNLPGIDLEHLRGALRPVLDARLFRMITDDVIASKQLARRGNLLHEPSHAPSLAGLDDELAAKVLARLRAAQNMPPLLKELADELRVDVKRVTTVAGVLVERGEAVKVLSDMLFAREAIDAMAAALREHLTGRGEITASGFRDLISASRKYCIPLLDYFDRSGLTVRVGDVRKLRRG
ncbi:MAG TPA: selenocysteine-specific translation elongation factor [Candidatus Limnocylindrales bacterium]|nr:selenocysteine-specific translation elongation factor [Candidatus Limnocylindrales bacterium]